MRHTEENLRAADLERRARILGVAQREFLNEGLEGSSIDRIAAQAEVSKREVYRYFSGKTALFEAVAHEIFGRARHTMAGTPSVGKSRRGILLWYASGVLIAYSEKTHLQLVRAAVAAGRHFPELAARLQRDRSSGKPVEGRLAELISEQHLGNGDPALQAVRLASLAIDGSRFLLGTPLPSPEQREEMADAAVDFYLHGYRGVESRILPFRPRPIGGAAGSPKPAWSASLRVPPERARTLLKVALEQFLHKGYRAVNLDAVATAAGVSNATVYRHFGNKEGLFRHVIGERIAEIARTPPRRFQAGDLRKVLAALARELLDWHVRPDSIALQRLMIEEAPDFSDLARSLHDTLAGLAARDLQAALQAHGQPPASDMAARTFRSFATLGPWLIEICHTPGSLERHALSEETAQVFLRGAGAPATRSDVRTSRTTRARRKALPA